MARDPVKAAMAKRQRERYPKIPKRPAPGSRAWYELELREEQHRLGDLEQRGAEPAAIEASRARILSLTTTLASW